MRRRCGLNVMVAVFVAACLLLPATTEGNGTLGYDVSDLSGAWSIHGVVSGAAPNVPGSFYMTGTADTGGSGTAADYADSQGAQAATWPSNTVSFDLSGGGILSIAGGGVPFHGAMNWDKDLVASVGTLRPGPDTGLLGHNLWLWVKQSSTPIFSIADGEGTWWLHGLYSGSSGAGWSHGKLEIDALGNFSFVEGTWTLSDDPDPNTPEDGSITITNLGIVGFSFDPNAHGVMNIGKDLVVFTLWEEGGGNFSILQKQSGVGAFALADLAGTWNMHEAFASSDPDWAGWAYGVVEVDNAGGVGFSVVNNDGSTETGTDTLAITGDGIVTIASDPNSHGTMSDDKNLVVLTTDNGVAGGDLLVLIRATVAPVYRFWSPQYARHFYTISEAEKNGVRATYPSSIWTYESEAFFAFPQNSEAGLAPVYRFWSPTSGGHFYTISEAEKDSIIATYPPSTWTYEGIVFYAYPDGSQPADTSPVYRFWSPTHGAHFYTISEAEKDGVIATYPPSIWTYEDIAWHAYD